MTVAELRDALRDFPAGAPVMIQLGGEIMSEARADPSESIASIGTCEIYVERSQTPLGYGVALVAA